MAYQYPDYESIILDRPADRVLRITMSRGKMNEMDFALHHAISEIWGHVENDPDTSVAILTGAGRAFSAGGDFALEEKVINEFEWKARMWKDGRNLVLNMLNFSKPLVSAINGPAAGGGLAAAMLADVSIMARSAKLADGHVRLGVAAGDHAAILWPLLCGMARTKYYLLTGKAIPAEEAERIGLVTMCVDDDKLQETALEVAIDLARAAPSAVRWTKHSLNNWLRMAWPIFETSLALEMLGFAGPEVQEGLNAHLEKRKPAFNPDCPL